MVNLGTRIKSLRLERHQTQQEVANRVGVSKAMISAYELSSRSPSFDLLVKIATLFAVSTDYLLGVERTRSISIDGLTDKQIELLSCMVEEFKKNKK